jgi:hypothetical protein
MKFEEYSTPFEGDFHSEARRLLGDQVEAYSRLQDAISDRYCTRDQYLRYIQDLLRIAISAGINDLVYRVDPHIPWIANEVVSRIEGRKITDIGCCDGFFTVYYAINHPDCQFTGIDISEDALEAAKRKVTEHGVTNVRWVQGDVLETNIDGEVHGSDTVILQDLLYQLYPNTLQCENLMLLRLAPHLGQGSTVIISQHGDESIKYEDESCPSDYSVHDHGNVSRYDRNAQGHINCDLVVFRKR